MNAIEMAQKYLNNVENNRKNRISSVISNDKRSLDEIVNTYINNYSPKYTSEDYKNIYKNELKKQKDIRKDIDTSFANQGVQTNTGYFTTQRNMLPVQQQSEITKNKKFEVYDNALEKNKEIEQKFQNIKKSDEYKKQEKKLIEQSNKVAYSKYDYDKAVVDEDDIGWYDKSLGTVIQGAKSVFDISGGLVKNENGDNYFLPNKTELKHQKVQDSYDSKFGKLLGNVGYEIGRIGTTTAINQVLPGVGSTMYYGRMFMDSTNNAISEGYDSGSAMVYGAVNTATEYLVGKALGSATKGLTGGKTNGFSNAISNTVNKLIKNPKISNVVGNAGSEATEEFIQEYLDNINKLAILEKSTNLKDYGSIFSDEEILQNALYSAGVGAITGGVFEGVSNTDGKIASNNTKIFTEFKNQLEESKKSINDVETIKKYDDVINSIDEYLKKPFGNEEKAEKILPTVEDIVKQESNVNNDYEIKKRSMSPTSDAFVAPNRTSKTDGAFASDNNSNTNIIENQEKIIKYTNHEIENFKNGKVKIATNPQDVSSFVESAKKVPSNAKLYFGKIGKTIADKIKSKLGIEIENYNISLKADSIKHILSHHSSNKESLRGQVPIVETDFNLIPEIVSNYDSVEESGITPQGKPVITFKKQIGDVYYLVNYVSNKNHNLEVQTMYKQQKKNSATASNANIPRLTSETDSGTSSLYANNIPQSNQNVKSDISSTINNMQNKEKNTINMSPVENRVETEPIIEEPQKLANILRERPVTMEEKDNWLVKLLKIKLLDKGHYVNELSRKTKNRELASKYDYMLGANGIAQQILGNERFNPKTQKSGGKGLYKIFEPIENSGKLQEFTEYMYHKHNVSRMSLNTLFQEDNKPIFGDGVTSETSKKIVEDFENKNPEFIEWAEEVYNYNNFLLDVLVDYGVIGKKDKSYYNNKYPYYVPTIRATDKTKTQMEFIGKKASVNTPIKKAKGGNQDIIPLKEAMALRTMQTLNSALRNNFGIELLNTIETEAESNKADIDEVVGDDIDAEEFLTKSTKKAPATLTVFQNGEKITFDIADEIYEALAPSQRHKIKALNNISKFRRALITEYNPAFMLTNPIKDVQDGALNSKHPSLFLKNIAEATKQISSKGDFYKLYLANGGSYETYFNYGEGYNKLPTKRGNLDPRKILDKISQINQSIEMTPRLAEFISSLEAGDSIETAMYNAQEITTNFKRGGDWTKNLDANGVTFLNAGVQGALKQVRNFQEAKSQGIKGITNLAVKWSIAGITPYILSQLIWGDDDDYEELSDYVKNNYYILWKNSDGTFVRIPKGRVMSVIQNLFKQPLDALKGEKINVKEFVELLQNQVLPSDPTESNIFSPLLDVAQNKTWYGGDLVPQRLQSLPSEEQYDESTDSISIWLGQKLGISPIKINYILDQYSGAIGDMILPTLTLEAENDSNSFMSNLLAPMKDKFTTDSVMNNQNLSDLYDLDDELTKKSKSSNATTEDILKSKYINSIQTEMNKLTSEKRTIQNDTTLTNNEKYKQVKEIQKQINQLAKDGLNNYKDVVSLSNYGKVAGIEYYLNSKKEWTKVDDKEIEALNEISMSNDDKNKYFNTKVKIGVIRSDDDKESNIKHKEIANLVINSNLSDEYKGYLYGKYYSSEKIIQNVLDANINIDEFIKFNSQEFTTDYYDSGKAVTNSRKNKVINYVNSLNLTIPQKAMLIKLEYSSYTGYDNQIVNYINNMKYSKFEKASILKSFGFGNYDKYLIDYVNKMSKTKDEKTEILENMGFTIRNGKVYS